MQAEEDYRRWDEQQVIAWLRVQGLSRFEQLFLDNDITSGDILCELSYGLLKELGLATVGERGSHVLGVHAGRQGSHRTDHSDHFIHSDSTIVESRPLDTPLRHDFETLKLNVIRVLGDDGTSRTVNILHANDAPSILRAVVAKFHIVDDDASKYQLFTSGEGARALSDTEIMAICKSANRNEKDRLVLRKKYQPPMRLDDKKKQDKGIMSPPHTANHLLMTSAHRNSVIMPDRPASELISMNLSKYFPETAQEELEHVGETIKRNSKLGGKRMSTWRKLTASEEAIPEGNEDDVLDEVEEEDVPTATTSIHEESHEDAESSSMNTLLETEISTSIVKYMKGMLLGTGSFGSVFLGLNAANGEYFAIKQVELTDDTSDERRHMMFRALQREIQLLKDLDHENIVRYLGSQMDGTHLNIFLEYVPGGSVAALLGACGKFEASVVKSYTRQILLGLNYLHEREIIHRDIKGGNILVDDKGVIKISDFGISQRVEESMDEEDVPSNHRLSLQGSPYWMAPEVVKRQHYTRKADIWSLGCLIVEMFTGEHPYPKFTPMQALFKIGSNHIPDIPEKISREAEDFLRQTFVLYHYFLSVTDVGTIRSAPPLPIYSTIPL